MAGRMKKKDRLLEDVFRYRKAVVLLTAAECGLFDYLIQNTAITREEAARHFGWEQRGTEILLNALCALGYLEKKQNRYRISSGFKDIFSRQKFPLLKEWLHHEWRLLNRWVYLPQVLETGKPYREPQKKTIHRNHRNFILSMAHREKENLSILLKSINLNGHHHLLDLGGGPGLFAATLAEKYPQLKATVFDTPETRSLALQFFNQSPAKSRLRFKGGNFLSDRLGKGYDAALLSSVLHIYSPQDNRELLRKIYLALNPGSQLIIRDFLLNPQKTGPLIGMLFAVNMLINTERGNAYTFNEIKSWLREAGFKDIKRKPLEGRMILIKARK
jgi:ubiquinone/menaquinone biosynthesis C-methylase UbiE